MRFQHPHWESPVQRDRRVFREAIAAEFASKRPRLGRRVLANGTIEDYVR